MTRRDFVALLVAAPAFRRLTKEPRWRTRHPVVFEKCREMGMTHARWADFTAGWRPLPPRPGGRVMDRCAISHTFPKETLDL